MSEAWRAVVEYQLLINGRWEDRKWTSKVYSEGSSGPMRQANYLVNELESGRFYEGSAWDKNLVKFKRDEVVVLAKYKEESDTWRQI
jgi:hypothetical protein